MMAGKSIVDDPLSIPRWKIGWLKQTGTVASINSPTFQSIERDLDRMGTVIKVGGSILDAPNSKEMFSELLALLPEHRVALVFGGGLQVESLRQADRMSVRPSQETHVEAIEVMGNVAVQMASMYGLDLTKQWPPCNNQSQSIRNMNKTILDVRDFLSMHEANCGGQPLPVGWSVTSDSIAARLAAVAGWDLLLVKSIQPPWTLQEAYDARIDLLADRGWVDEFFPHTLSKVKNIWWTAPNQPVEFS